MTTAKYEKRTLILCAISLLLCLSALIGTTFAWFTDRARANSIVKTGNLDIELYYQAPGQDGWTRVTETTNLFQKNTLWEPGHAEVIRLKIENADSLALKYQLGVKVVTEVASINVLGDGFKLSNYIRFGIIDGAQNYTREQAIEAVEASGTTRLNDRYVSDMISLLPKNNANGEDNEKIVTMVVYLPATVGNVVNYAEDANIPIINLGINLLAIQKDFEYDSYGNEYDKGLEQYIFDISKLVEAVQDGNAGIIQNDLVTDHNNETLMYSPAGTPIYVDGNGYTITTSGVGTAPGSNDYGYVGFIPAKGEDAVVKNLKVVGSGFVEIGHHDGKQAIGGGNYTVTNLIIEDLVATLAINNCGHNIAAAFTHYGKAVMTDCVLTGATSKRDTHKGYDAGFVNGTRTDINGGKYGRIFMANQAHVTITGAEVDTIDCTAIAFKNLGSLTVGAGAKIGTINLMPSGTYQPSLIIEDGAEIGQITYKGVTYTVEEWLAR